MFSKSRAHAEGFMPRPTGGEAILEVEKISFAYPDTSRPVLDDLSIALYPGQVLGLCGANGSGKTTLFRCITGLLAPQRGEIRLGGRVMRAPNDFHDLRCQVGFVLQHAEDQLFFPSVGEDLAFGPLNLGLSEQQARERALESLAMVGLEGYENRLTHQLSGGEKKLVALAAILAMRPRALLLDEPLNELDAQACKNVTEAIRKLHCAMMVISHNMEFLEEISARRLLLENGSLTPLE